MSIENIKNRIQKEAIVDTQWLERAQWRSDNEDWLDISFEIAVKIGSALSKNKALDIFPRNQKELAEAMNVSPQYVNKVVKGSENLQLETISKIQKILEIKLIEVPNDSKKETTIHNVAFNLMKQNLNFFYASNVYSTNELTKILDEYRIDVPEPDDYNSISSVNAQPYSIAS